MSESQLPEVFAAQIVFWLLLPIVLWGRIHWSVLAWLVMGNLDGTGPSATGPTTEIGLINAIKGVAIPIFLTWRMRRIDSSVQSLFAGRLWILTTLYATLASFWSPFPLAAAKLVANMAGIFLSIIVLEKAARSRLITTTLLIRFAAATILLALVQTLYFGGTAYGFDGLDQPVRFSSFVSAQQYAALLVALLSAVLFWKLPIRVSVRLGLVVSLCTALALNGSRTWVLGAAAVLCIYFFFALRRTITIATCALLVGGIFAISLADVMRERGSLLQATQSRILATAMAVISGEDTNEQAGLRTFTFRLGIYDGVFDELGKSSYSQLILGHGTSSGAVAALNHFPSRYSADKIDPNRIIHNEWLRALFEWGALGFVLLISVFVAMIVGYLRQRTDFYQIGAFLAYLPALVTALTTENILAGAGNAVTLSFAFLAATVWIPRSSTFKSIGHGSTRSA